MRTPSPLPAALAAALAAMIAAQIPAAAQPMQDLGDIVVSPNRTPTEAARAGSAVSVVTRADLEATGEIALVDALTRLPGIAIQQAGGLGSTASIRLRGLAGAYVQVRVDGIDISDPSGPQVTTPLGLLNTGDVERVEVLRGSQSALYGGQAVAGVIAITTRRAARAGISHSAFVEVGAYETAAAAYTITAGSERAEGALSVSSARTSGFSAAEQRAGNPERDGAVNLTVSGSGEVRVTDGLALGGALRFVRADTDFDGFDNATFLPADAPNDEAATSYGGRLHAKVDLGPFANEFAVQYFRNERISRTATSRDRFDGDRIRGEWLAAASLADWADLQLGADWMRESADVPGFAADSDILGSFAQLSLEPVDRLTLALAARRDEHSEFGGFSTGRATAALRATPETVLRASLATGFRAPSLFELFSPAFGNAALTPETSLSWDMAVERSLFDGRASVSAGYFDIRIEDRIDFDFATFRYAQRDGGSRAKGVELTAAAQPLDWLGLVAAYTYTDARDAQTDARSARVPRHQASFGVTVQPVTRLSLGLDALLVDDLPNGGATPVSYAVFNARAGWRLTPETELFVRANNLLDRDYQTLAGYGTAGLSVFAGVRATW